MFRAQALFLAIFPILYSVILAAEHSALPPELRDHRVNMEYENCRLTWVLEAFERQTEYRVFVSPSFLEFSSPVTLATQDLAIDGVPARADEVLRAIVFNALRDMDRQCDEQFRHARDEQVQFEKWIEVTHHDRIILLDARIRKVPEPVLRPTAEGAAAIP